jgi:hypothetical protein
MKSNQLISSLSYFSLFFAPFLFPVAVYFIVDDDSVKEHAKKAFLSHLFPIIFIPFIIFFAIQQSGALTVLFIILVILANIGVFIWNVVKGIKVLM